MTPVETPNRLKDIHKALVRDGYEDIPKSYEEFEGGLKEDRARVDALHSLMVKQYKGTPTGADDFAIQIGMGEVKKKEQPVGEDLQEPAKPDGEPSEIPGKEVRPLAQSYITDDSLRRSGETEEEFKARTEAQFIREDEQPVEEFRKQVGISAPSELEAPPREATPLGLAAQAEEYDPSREQPVPEYIINGQSMPFDRFKQAMESDIVKKGYREGKYKIEVYNDPTTVSFVEREMEEPTQAEAYEFHRVKPEDMGKAESAFHQLRNSWINMIAAIPETSAIAQKRIGDFFGYEGYEGKDVEDLADYKMGQSLRNYVIEIPDEYKDDFLVSHLPSGVGSATGIIAGGGIAGGISKGAGLATSGFIGGSSMGADAYREAKEMGADDDKAFYAWLANMGIGAVESINYGRFLNRLNKASGNGVSNALAQRMWAGTKGGIEEGIEEVLQGVASNYTAQELYDFNREIMPGWKEPGAGAIVGFALNAMGAKVRQKIDDPNISQEDKEIYMAIEQNHRDMQQAMISGQDGVVSSDGKKVMVAGEEITPTEENKETVENVNELTERKKDLETSIVTEDLSPQVKQTLQDEIDGVSEKLESEKEKLEPSQEENLVKSYEIKKAELEKELEGLEGTAKEAVENQLNIINERIDHHSKVPDDSKDKERVPSEEQVGEEPVEGQPDEGPSPEEIESSRVLQEEEVAEPTEPVAEEVTPEEAAPEEITPEAKPEEIPSPKTEEDVQQEAEEAKETEPKAEEAEVLEEAPISEVVPEEEVAEVTPPPAKESEKVDFGKKEWDDFWLYSDIDSDFAFEEYKKKIEEGDNAKERQAHLDKSKEVRDYIDKYVSSHRIGIKTSVKAQGEQSLDRILRIAKKIKSIESNKNLNRDQKSSRVNKFLMEERGLSGVDPAERIPKGVSPRLASLRTGTVKQQKEIKEDLLAQMIKAQGIVSTGGGIQELQGAGFQVEEVKGDAKITFPMKGVEGSVSQTVLMDDPEGGTLDMQNIIDQTKKMPTSEGPTKVPKERSILSATTKVEDITINIDDASTIANNIEVSKANLKDAQESGDKKLATAIEKHIEKLEAAHRTMKQIEQTDDVGEVLDYNKEQTSPPGIMGLAFEPSLVSSPMDIGIAAKKKWQKWFTSRGYLPEEVFQRSIKMEGSTNAILRDIKYTTPKFKKAITEAYGIAPKKADIMSVDRALKGELPISELPVPLQEITASMRNQIDFLSNRMLKEGIVEGELEKTIQENLGTYMTRSYRAFDDPAWSEVVPDRIKNRAKSFIRDQFKSRGEEISEKDIDGLIEELLYSEEAPINVLAGSKLGSKDLGILKKRKDVPPEIRALLGEYKDPLLNYAKSVTKMASLLERSKFLYDVKDMGMNEFLFEKPQPGYAKEIAGKGSKTMNPLNGLYTSKDIAEAFKQMDPPDTKEWFKWYMRANSMVKYTKTIGSIQTHIRNLFGNTGFMIMNGHVKAGEMSGAIKTTANDLFNLNNKELNEKYKHYLELGVVGESARGGEVKELLKDVVKSKGNFEEVVDSRMSRMWGSAKKTLTQGITNLYMSEDDIFKIYAFENEKARYAKAYPTWTEAQVEEKAANIVRNTYPTYSLVPEVIKKLRKFPLVGTFTSFPAEVIRTTYNTIQITKEELQHPETRSIGIKRMAGMLTTAALPGALVLISKWAFDVEEEEDDAMRRYLPPWSKNSRIFHLGQKDDGKWKYVDMSYSIAHSYLDKPLNAMLKGEDTFESGVKALGEMFEPFIGEEILASKLIDISRNTDDEGRTIYNPQEPTADKLAKVSKYLAETFEPGTARSFRRIWKGIHGDDVGGITYDPVTEAVATFTGLRISDIDVPRSFSFKARRVVKDLADAKGIFNSVYYKTGSTQEQIDEAYTKANEASQRILTEAHKDYQAAMRLGVTPEELDGMLSDSRLSKANIKAIQTGEYTRFKDKSRVDSVYNNFENMSTSQKYSAARAYIKSDPELYKDLVARIKKESKGKR